MSTIVYSTDKKTGNKFAYETYSVKILQQVKQSLKKKYLGRVDPETGEIIPKGESGKRNRKLSTIAREEASRKDRSEIDALNSTIADLSVKLSLLEQDVLRKDLFVNTILEVSHQYTNLSLMALERRRLIG